MHASGRVTQIQKRNFTGRLRLEAADSEEDYIAWRQKGTIFAAVNRFNVVSFWSTLTGRLIYRSVLDGPLI